MYGKNSFAGRDAGAEARSLRITLHSDACKNEMHMFLKKKSVSFHGMTQYKKKNT